MWQILQPKTPNVTPINAPYRVRVIEMVIEAIFGETVECTLQYLTSITLHPQILSSTQSHYVSVNRCFHLNVYK